jgi:hypothetical protein
MSVSDTAVARARPSLAVGLVREIGWNFGRWVDPRRQARKVMGSASIAFQSRKPDNRISPLVRMIRSGSGRSAP